MAIYENKISKIIKYGILNLLDSLANLININIAVDKNEILVIHLSSQLGDFLMLLPALHLLCQQYPDKTINLIMHKRTSGTGKKVNTKEIPWSGFLPEGILDRIIILPSVKPRDMFAMRKMYKNQIHPYKIYSIGTREGTFKHQLLVNLWIRLMGFKGKTIGNAQTDNLNWKYPIHYRSHVLSKLASILSDDEFSSIKTLSVNTNYNRKYVDYQFSDGILKNVEADSLLVAIVPGSRMVHKRWPVERFASVAKKILDEYPKSIIVLSGLIEDRELGDLIKQQCQPSVRIIDIIGKTNVAQLAAVFSRMDVVITVDGGSMHLADMMGAAVIGLCPGILNPLSIEPWHNYANSIRKSIGCSPCYSYHTCRLGTNACLQSITVSEVMQKFQIIYEKIQQSERIWKKDRVFKVIRNKGIVDFEEI